MNLYEYQGKALFKQFGIPVPRGIVIESPDDVAVREIVPPVVLKAQVLTGGRGKAGAVCKCATREDIRHSLGALFRMKVKGETVAAVLAEELIPVERELYLSLSLSAGPRPVIIAGKSGGIEIEEVARTRPSDIVTLSLNPLTVPADYQSRFLSRFLDAPHSAVASLVGCLWNMFRSTDAVLAEINPLAVTASGLVALDSKVALDNKASFRQGSILQGLAEEQARLSRNSAGHDDRGVTYIPLDGTVGIISDGAGTGMLALDLVTDRGGRPANFCDMSGATDQESIYQALELVASNSAVRSILIVLIGGFNRMDEMARGILRFRDERGFPVPVFVRMCGTMEDEARAMMEQEGLCTYYYLTEAVEAAVRCAEVAS